MSPHFRFSSSGTSTDKALNASMIGRNPVHRQIFPSNEYSTSPGVNFGFDKAKLCIFMTNPGVQ